MQKIKILSFIYLLLCGVYVYAQNKTDHDSLYKYYKEKNDAKQALFHLTKAAAISDSLYTKEYQAKTDSLQKKFDTEKKKQEIKALKQESTLTELVKNENNRESNRLWLIIICGVVLMILLVVFMIVLNKNRKIKERTNKILELKNKELEKQKNILEEKNNQILDSIEFAKSITGVLHPTENELKDSGISIQKRIESALHINGFGFWLKKIKGRSFMAIWNFPSVGVPASIYSIQLSHFLNSLKEQAINQQTLSSFFDLLNKTALQLAPADKNKFSLVFILVDHDKNSADMIWENAGIKSEQDKQVLDVSSAKATPIKGTYLIDLLTPFTCNISKDYFSNTPVNEKEICAVRLTV